MASGRSKGKRPLFDTPLVERLVTSSKPLTQSSSSIETNASTTAPSIRRRGRGPCKLIALEKIKAALGGPILVEIDPNTARPSSEAIATYLPRAITHTVMTMAPQKGKKSWKDVTDEEKEPLFEHLQMSFKINDIDQEHVRRCLEEYFQNSYSRYRHKCYRHYCRMKENVDPRLHPLQGVQQDDWNFLCSHFESSNFQHLSSVNTLNREKLQYTHCMGPKPFVIALAQKQESVDSIQSVDRIKWFAETRTSKKTGIFCSVKAENAYKKMKELQAASQELDSLMTNDQIYDQVMGKRSGYIKGLGQGPKPLRSKFASLISEREAEGLRKELVSTQNELSSTQDRLESTEKDLAIARERIKFLTSDREVVQKEMADMQDRQRKVENMLQALLGTRL